MEYVFLGGAGEVGGSCLLISVAGRKILIDCGLRMCSEDRYYSALPNLLLLKELAPKLDAVLISHAHADHVGGVPILHQHYPDTPIYMTDATQELAITMLKNFARSQERISYYTPKDVMTALVGDHIKIYDERYRIRDIGWKMFDEWGDDWGYRMILSGHILGAVSILLNTPEGRFLYTGDVSAFHQKTVDGIADLSGRNSDFMNSDFMWCEATYGDRDHPSRSTEEQDLVNEVAAVIENGGTVLIPSFALGRAQEIILILKRAMEDKKIPKFPVFIDGLVNQICDIYARHEHTAGRYFQNLAGEALQKRLKKKHASIFYSDTFRPVARGQKVSIGKNTSPKCIIASSGMLNGGPSVGYAKALATDARNAIFLSGYQDAESPGRRLQELQQGDTLTFADDDVVEVNCQVKRFYLSAHSDKSQLIRMIRQVSPKALALVHGDKPVINALREKLKTDFAVTVPINELPENETANPEWAQYMDPTVLHIDCSVDGKIVVHLHSKEHEKKWAALVKDRFHSAVLQGDHLIIKAKPVD